MLFEKKIRGLPLSITIKIESKLPYPKEENERREKYGDPLCEIFRPYFEELAVAYHPNDEKRVLGAITIHCHEPKFSYKKSEEKQFNANFYRMYSDAIISFFKNIETTVSIENVHAVSDSFQEIIDMRLKQKEKLEHGIKEDYEPSTVGNKPTVVRTSKTGEEDLIVDLGKNVDPSDISEEGMTIQKTEDGKYHVGFISKKNKKRYYAEVPKDLGEKLLRHDEKGIY